MSDFRSGGFAGELGLLSLFDVSQLLALNRATGVLVVTNDDRTGYLYFQDGKLANAIDDRHAEGENAAYLVFSWRTGRFEFRPEPASGRVLIEESTEAVMLEAARRMDEAAESAAGSGGAPENRQTERLLGTQSSLEALRDVFKTLAHETGIAMATGGISVTRLFGIAAPDDRVLLRPGHPTRVKIGGIWSAISDLPLSREDYHQLASELLAASLPEGPDPARSRTRRLVLATGATARLTRVIDGGLEALWIRPVAIAAPPADGMTVDTAALEALLDRQDGLTLVSAVDTGEARQALHTLIAARDRRHQDLAVVIGAEPIYTHATSSGTVLQLAPEDAPGRLASLEPELVALEPDVEPATFAHGPAHAAWWAAIGGPDPASAACRWALRATAAGRPPALAILGAIPVTLVHVTPDDDGRLAARILPLGEPERALWLAGDAAALFAALGRGDGRPALKVLNGGR